jgi:CRP/FNR family cyclic AMP-dependent transcriptional regulator
MDSDEQARSFLSEESWLKGTPAEFRHAVVSACRFRWYEGGDAVASAGEQSTSIFAVVSGSLAATSVRGPRDARLSYIIPAGFWSGMVPLFTGRTRIVHHVARSRTLIAHLEANSIRQMLEKEPGWWRHFGYLNMLMLEVVTGFASDLLTLDNRRRCIASLLHCGNLRWAPVPATSIEVELSQDELSSVACISRKTVGRILKALERERLVEVGYRSIKINDVHQLQRIADDE